MLDKPAVRFEGRDVYLALCPAFGTYDEWPAGPYFRLLVIADEEQLGFPEAAKLAKTAVARGAYSTLAVGGAAEDVEEAFSAAVVEGRYETVGRTYLTAVVDAKIDEVLWEAFYSMLGDADIEEDVPPIVILLKAGDARADVVRALLPRLGEAFKAVTERKKL